MIADNLINQEAEAYADYFTSPENSLLNQINKETTERHQQAHLLSGHVQGRLLSFISIMLQPRYVLEIGTFTGYSALCLAEGLQKDGELHTIELRDDDANTAQKNFMKAEKHKLVTLHRGKAIDILQTLPHLWDLVFIDADKTAYIEYYEKIVPQLSDKGVIIADNVLFHGQVLDQPPKGKNAIAIHEFNKHVLNDERVEQVMLTIRDGLLIIKKKQ
ncbi:O-methyltransferase [Ferruginibacter sp.]|uniref:O-methyltransferase n=1 Tax=Ferruginibacter sp. TaxID=1940288 RepID=UPI0026597487|nr:O-methyltransferase [Ferruginibacter sp.]